MTHYTVPVDQAEVFIKWCEDNNIQARREAWNVPMFSDKPGSAGARIGRWNAAFAIPALDDSAKTLMKLSWEDLGEVKEEMSYFFQAAHENQTRMIRDVIKMFEMFGK